MWTAFILENVSFAINLVGSLVFFTVFWLYFDAWQGSKKKAEVFKAFGFLILSVSFVIHALQLETGGSDLSIWINSSRILGYLVLVVGILLDPILSHPSKSAGLLIYDLGFKGLQFLQPVLAGFVGLLYFRRATVGMESHLKKISLSFFILSVSELLSLGYLFRESTNVSVYNFVAPFGILWIIQHIVFLISILILGKWSFSYLFKRFTTQIFIIVNLLILIIFLLTTVTFTGLILKNLQDETLQRLETDVRVLNFGVEARKKEIATLTNNLAIDNDILNYITSDERGKLYEKLAFELSGKNEDSLIVLDPNGKVLAYGEDKDKYGDSYSENVVFKRTIKEGSVINLVKKENAITPQIAIEAGSAVFNGEKLVGVIIARGVLDNAFTDGIKSSTGLTSSIYAGDTLSATSIILPDNKTRPVGIKLDELQVLNKVLGKGESYIGVSEVLNTKYFSAFYPLSDIDNIPVGMLFAGETQLGVLKAASKSVEFTFLVTAMMIVLSIIPVYLISKYLSSQLK